MLLLLLLFPFLWLLLFIVSLHLVLVFWPALIIVSLAGYGIYLVLRK